jgi:phage pi2 protein 07
LERDKDVLKQRRSEEAVKGIENVAKLFKGRKSSLSTSMTKRRLTSTAKAGVKESEELIKKYEAELADLDKQMQAEIDALQTQSTQSIGTIREVYVQPLKKDIVVELFGLAWLPHYAIKSGDDWLMISGDD